jgi:hypothetical protein
LRQPQALAKLPRIGNAPQPCQLIVGERRVGWVGTRVLEGLLAAQRGDARPAHLARALGVVGSFSFGSIIETLHRERLPARRLSERSRGVGHGWREL